MKNRRKTCWYEMCPGYVFKAVSLGIVRKRWFSRPEHLVLYRAKFGKNHYCVIDWVNEKYLVERS
jgi:hypothetical protein